MAKLPVTGRESLFRGKAGGDRVQGVITPIGSRRFEAARARLGRMVGRDAERVSDADVIEFLARGEEESRKVLGVKA
jgi:cobalamin biosynthesis protein CobD/CbiB